MTNWDYNNKKGDLCTLMLWHRARTRTATALPREMTTWRTAYSLGLWWQQGSHIPNLQQTLAFVGVV